jgi:Holliday junction resolvase RusA-like endonuclease
MTNSYHFSVLGNPVPKQSFRAVAGGRGYTDPRVKAWQEKVAYEARYVMDGDEPLTGDLQVSLKFYLSDRRRKDLDNLSKGVLDALNGIVFVDDRQIVDLHLQKYYDKDNPGVSVCVTRVKA